MRDIEAGFDAKTKNVTENLVIKLYESKQNYVAIANIGSDRLGAIPKHKHSLAAYACNIGAC